VSEEVQSESPANHFPGHAFAQAREQQGLSIEQVSRQLNLSRSMVQAIEKGNLEYLSDPVFSRGYVRSYARLLKLDADAMVASYNQATGQLQTTGTVKSIGSVSTVPGRHHGRPLLKIGSWLFVLAIVAASVWWWQTQQGGSATQRESLGDASFAIETSDGTTLLLPPPGDEIVEPPLQESEAEIESSEPESESVNEMEEAQTESPLPEVETAAVSADGLQVSFSEDCWISVRELGGRTLFNGVAKAGQSLQFQSEVPLNVVVGKVDAVSHFSFAGQSIDLAGMSKNNVARLSLPL
jgi:cytoskeleton protein RodZ